MYWLYFPAFAVVILGLIIYFWHAKRTSFLCVLFPKPSHELTCHSTAEDQGKIEPRVPEYVNPRHDNLNIVAGQV